MPCFRIGIKCKPMTDLELKNLKDNLWHSADMLRAGAHLAANKYGQPILGLIFLRYADVLFKQHKAEIDAEYNKYKGSRMERAYKDVANVLFSIISTMRQMMPTRLCW